MCSAIDERQKYDLVYTQYKVERTQCQVSCHVLDKARRNVRGVMHSLGLPSLNATRVLDVGCGLGYFAEALREKGASVTAIDTSPIAIDLVKELFPKVDARIASFPKDCSPKRKFDIIWACDFSLLNTFDVDFMCREFFQPALMRLEKNGVLIVGWHSNFSGTMGKTNWAHWPIEMIRRLTETTGLSGPRVVSLRTSFLSRSLIHVCRFLEKSIPIYFFRRLRSSENHHRQFTFLHG